ncbi:metalloendoproteinase 5-MMP-like [Rutidosis leptorrhynchoides]|uniref:metalloendoproteinase 5-MMP-like n=1 Tax=Rutidosis leptorrhynchoides TaxID=125765 RepID=UPI003A9A3B74
MAVKFSMLPFLFIFFVLVVGNDKKSSPFVFIKHLEGAEKGTKSQGLDNLRQYLARFGYLNYCFAPNDQENYFDEELEAALKRYQINVTGKLDGPTVSQMMKPRCEVSDYQTHQV